MSKLSTLSVISNNSLATLRDYVASYAGLNGGDPRSPVWLCALEWGRGLVKAVEDNGAPHGEGSFSKYDKDYYYLNFPKNLHSNTGTGDYFPKKVISS